MYRTRYMMFIKYAAFHLQHLNLWKNQKNTDCDNENSDILVHMIFIFIDFYLICCIF